MRAQVLKIAALLTTSCLAGCRLDFEGSRSCDVDADCGTGASCARGRCAACPSCAAGEACIAAQCLPTACGDRLCAPGTGCQEGWCIESACLGVECAADEACVGGACHPADCAGAACGEQEVCWDDACTASSCVGVRCPAGEACAGGECFPLDCAGSACAGGAVCRDGVCGAAACAGVTCRPGTACAAGRCLPQDCPASTCGANEVCSNGACAEAACVDLSCPAASLCAAGACVPCSAAESACGDRRDEDCDGAPDCADADCLDQPCGAAQPCGTPLCGPAGACTPALVLPGTVCRTSAGDCDLEEVCDGAALGCPVDVVEVVGTVCRAGAGPCDAEETCDGASAACPDDKLAAANTPCRVAADVCDVQEVCSGSSALCPDDAVAPATIVCRPAPGGCDQEERCDGTTATCPDDRVLALGTACRPAAGVCDAEEQCDGLGAACPSDQPASAGQTCRPSASICDAVETCSGSSTVCPADGALPGCAPAILTFAAGTGYDFGPVPVGSRVIQALTVSNGGTVAASLGPLGTAALGLSGPFTYAGGTCSSNGTLAGGASCTLAIEFAPPAAAGYGSSLALVYHDGDANRSVFLSLSGNGQQASGASLEIWEGPGVDYGAVLCGAGLTVTRIFTVYNAGTAPATGLAGQVTGASAFSFSGTGFPGAGGTCVAGGSLAPATLCNLVVSFTPGVCDAPSGATVAVAYSGGSAPAASLAVTGYSTSKVRAREVSLGFVFGCALMSNGGVKCWGTDVQGQLGLGDTLTRGDEPDELGNALPFVNLGTGVRAKALATAHDSACAVLEDDTLKCWGYNAGKLALGDSANRGDAPGEMGDALPRAMLGTGRRVKQVAGGKDHFCAILEDSTLKCWGWNFQGQLGYGDTTHRGDSAAALGDALLAVDLGAGRRVRQVSAGDAHTCAVLDDATLKCWGANANGQLGLGDVELRGDGPGEMGDALPAVDLGPGAVPVAVVASRESTCALLRGGAVKCWGYNSAGQLGQGDTATRGDGAGEMGGALPTIDLGTGRTATQLGFGWTHGCAVLDDATLKCWGENNTAQLGLGDDQNRGDVPGEMGEALPRVDLGRGRRALRLSVRNDTSCVVLDDQLVKCWGSNTEAQLGLGDLRERGYTPESMGDGLPIVPLVSVGLAAGWHHTCAMLEDLTVRCWGANDLGQLGLGDTTPRGGAPGEMSALPAVNLGGRLALKLAAGVAHTCALLDDRSVRCWGDNGAGQLGIGSVQIRGDGPGEMGSALAAVPLGTGRTAKAVAAGGAHTCAILDDSTLKCWGNNSAGQLGQGHSTDLGDGLGELGDALPPIALGTGRTVRALAAGYDHNCALLDDGSVKCWGFNAEGALGLGDMSNRGDGANEMGGRLPAVALGAGRTARAIAAGDFHSCALLDDATLKCWGNNGEGRLGLGELLDRGDQANEMGDLLPRVNLGAGRTVRAVSAFASGTCAILDDLSTRCWGKNTTGQLGLGDLVSRGTQPADMGAALPPVLLGASSVPVSLSSRGFGHTCALLADHAIKCWGLNASGELGLGDRNDRGDAPGEMGDVLPAVFP